MLKDLNTMYGYNVGGNESSELLQTVATNFIMC